jgi:hypothetical protein
MPLLSMVTIATGVCFILGEATFLFTSNRIWHIAYGVALICTGLFALRSSQRAIRDTESYDRCAELRARHEAIQRAAFPTHPRSS